MSLKHEILGLLVDAIGDRHTLGGHYLRTPRVLGVLADRLADVYDPRASSLRELVDTQFYPPPAMTPGSRSVFACRICGVEYTNDEQGRRLNWKLNPEQPEASLVLPVASLLGCETLEIDTPPVPPL
jgi:hypothetical protein